MLGCFCGCCFEGKAATSLLGMSKHMVLRVSTRTLKAMSISSGETPSNRFAWNKPMLEHSLPLKTCLCQPQEIYKAVSNTWKLKNSSGARVPTPCSSCHQNSYTKEAKNFGPFSSLQLRLALSFGLEAKAHSDSTQPCCETGQPGTPVATQHNPIFRSSNFSPGSIPKSSLLKQPS